MNICNLDYGLLRSKNGVEIPIYTLRKKLGPRVIYYDSDTLMWCDNYGNLIHTQQSDLSYTDLGIFTHSIREVYDLFWNLWQFNPQFPSMTLQKVPSLEIIGKGYKVNLLNCIPTAPHPEETVVVQGILDELGKTGEVLYFNLMSDYFTLDYDSLHWPGHKRHR